MADEECSIQILAVKVGELEKRMTLHMSYQEDAVAKAASELSARLETMNQFRDQLREQSKSFVTQPIYDARHQRLEEQIESINKILGRRLTDLEIAKSNLEGRIWALAAVMAIVELGIQIWAKMH